MFQDVLQQLRLCFSEYYSFRKRLKRLQLSIGFKEKHFGPKKLTILDARLKSLLSNKVMNLTNDRGEISIEVHPGDLRETMKVLKENSDFSLGNLSILLQSIIFNMVYQIGKLMKLRVRVLVGLQYLVGVRKINPHGVLQWYIICCL